jgi:hypothetical protein
MNFSPIEDFPKGTLTPSMDMSALKQRESKLSGKIQIADLARIIEPDIRVNIQRVTPTVTFDEPLVRSH